jgi:cytidylate kinase
MIIAIDGPAASGKGTLGRRLASHFGLHHLDTGLTYRAVAAALLAAGAPLDDEDEAVHIAERLDFGRLDPQGLATQAIGEAASRVAVMPALREVLVRRQREFAMMPPGAVLDGRDVGTVICPDARVKLYVTATAAERARRRTGEMAARGEAADAAAILADIERRDARDMNRPVAPLKPALDAHLLDTSEMDIETAFRAAVDIVEKAVARG